MVRRNNLDKKKTQQKTLKDAAAYLKGIIPVNIPESYALKPMFKKVSGEENIRSGILAYRDFLYLLCDRLIANGDLYDKPVKNIDSHLSMEVRFPLLYNVNNVLFKIGYHGKLADNHKSLILRDPQLLCSSAMKEGGCGKSNLSAVKVVEALIFLADCGFCFDGIESDTAKPTLPELTKLEVTYPDNPAVLTGIKAMAIAQKELRTKNNHEIFQWCDYKVLMAEEPDAASRLNDFAHSLPVKIRDFVLKMNKHFLEAGLTCNPSYCGINLGFHYFHKNKEIFSFFASPVPGYRLMIKAQNTHKYPDTIKSFPLPLQEKIARGYGCNPKKFAEPCQHGCHGFSFSLDDSALKLANDIITWIDKELSCLQRK
jgi:hypothetical protein